MFQYTAGPTDKICWGQSEGPMLETSFELLFWGPGGHLKIKKRCFGSGREVATRKAWWSGNRLWLVRRVYRLEDSFC